MSDTVPLGPGQILRRSLDEAFTQMMASRYQNADTRPLFLPKTFRDMREFLFEYSPRTRLWSDEFHLKLWKEVRGRHPETFLVAVYEETTRAWGVDRNIRTATFRGYHSTHAPRPGNPDHHEKQFMWEFKSIEDGSLEIRIYDNSGSEKFYWTELTYLHAIKRIFREELGFNGRYDKRTGKQKKRVTPELLERVHLLDPARVYYYKDGESAQDYSRHESGKFPYLMTNNELWHTLIEIPDEYYQPWYHEAGTRNLFVFGPIDSPPNISHLRDLGLSLDDLNL